MISQKKIQNKSGRNPEKSEKRRRGRSKVTRKTTTVVAETKNKRVEVSKIRNRKASCPEILLHNTRLFGKELPELFKLIKIGEADLTSLAIMGIFPLHDAIAQGLTDCAKVLIERASNINVRNSEGHSPLDVAVETGNFECAELLIRHGANTDDIRHGFKLRSSSLRKKSSTS